MDEGRTWYFKRGRLIVMAIQNSYEKNRNFNQCPFLVTLPQLTVREGSVRVLIKILSKAGKAVDVTLNEILLSDKLDRKYNQHFEGLGKTKSIPQKEISVDIEIEKKLSATQIF